MTVRQFSAASRYLIPGVQLGSKVLVHEETGKLLDVYSVSRPVSPDRGCRWCTGFIPSGKLQEDAQDAEERHRQRYVNDPDVIAPSVITMNATAAAHAANDFLFTATGLTFDHAPRDYLRVCPRERSIVFDEPRADPDCSECGRISASRRARGDFGRRLPTRG